MSLNEIKYLLTQKMILKYSLIHIVKWKMIIYYLIEVFFVLFYFIWPIFFPIFQQQKVLIVDH